MNVFGPMSRPNTSSSALPADWTIQGVIGEGQLSIIERDGVPALRVVNGADSFVAAKPTRASLLATPYLSWAWNLDPSDVGPHPVRIVVGLNGGNTDVGSRADPSRPPPPQALPAHDRAIVMVWDQSALRRGTIVIPKPEGKRQPPSQYAVRGGRENMGSWWLETVDLSDIYRRSWPADLVSDVRITFIGIAAAPGEPPSPALVSGIRLSR